MFSPKREQQIEIGGDTALAVYLDIEYQAVVREHLRSETSPPAAAVHSATKENDGVVCSFSH